MFDESGNTLQDAARPLVQRSRQAVTEPLVDHLGLPDDQDNVEDLETLLARLAL